MNFANNIKQTIRKKASKFLRLCGQTNSFKRKTKRLT